MPMQQLVVKAVSLAIARDGASGGVVRTVIVRHLVLRACYYRCFISMFHRNVICHLQINADGVTRNFYPGDSLQLWHEELEPCNSLLDILNTPSPEPMNI